MNTNYFANLAAGNVFGTKTSPKLPDAYFIGLSTTEPDLDGDGVSEPASGTGYARVHLNNLTEPEDGLITNASAIDFDESTSNWGVVTHFVVYDSGTLGEGNLLIYGALTAKRSIEANTIMTFKKGAFNLTVPNSAQATTAT